MRPTHLRLAQVAIGVLLLIILRSLGEIFRLQHLHGEALTVTQVVPYVGGALFAAAALAFSLLCYFVGRYLGSIAVTVATILLLFTYKVVILG